MESNQPISIKQANYLSCKLYQEASTADDGINKFDKDEKYYFSFSENGILLLRSKGYNSDAEREDGIIAVLQNMENENQYYVFQQEDDQWIFVLVSANHHEIARSCSFDSQTELLHLLPSARAKAKRVGLHKANAAAMILAFEENAYLV